jgi:hypothetical protein
MPYKSVDELPAQFSKYSSKGKRAALQTFNNVYAGKSSESKAFASAHAKGRIKPTTKFSDDTDD